MFLLVSVRHVGAHPDELQHGVSLQSSKNLGKTFPRISRIRIFPSAQILARDFVHLPPFISQIPTFSVGWFWLLFWSILNGVTLETGNKAKVVVVYKRVSKTVFDWETKRLFFKVVAYDRGVVGSLWRVDSPYTNSCCRGRILWNRLSFTYQGTKHLF